MIRDHLDRLPEHAGWAESHDWVEVALDLDEAVHADLLANHLIPSLFRLAMGDGSVAFDDTAEGILSLVEHLEPDERTARGPLLHGITPQPQGSARRLLAADAHIGRAASGGKV